MICFKGIKKSFRDQEVLKDISFETEGGSCIGIIGNNGCGKSTLLDILAGCKEADGGSFIYNGIDLLKDRNALSKVVGYVPQENVLFDELTVMDNLLFWYSKDVIIGSLKDGVLCKLGIGDMKKKVVSKMSGGMKKRLAIACAAANKPDVLLMDEPSASLDRNGKDFVLEFLKMYKENSGVVILSTHEEKEMELCDSLYKMEDGYLEKIR